MLGADAGSCWPAASPRSSSVALEQEIRAPRRSKATVAHGTGSPQCIPVLPSSAELSWIQPRDFLTMTATHPPVICSMDLCQRQQLQQLCPSQPRLRGSYPSSEQMFGGYFASEQMFVVILPLSRCLWLFCLCLQSHHLISICIPQLFQLSSH